MAYEHKDGFGNLFKNKKKEEGSKQPDYRGEIMVGGQLWELAGWIKVGEHGKYVSLKGQEPREQEKPKAAAPAKGAHGLSDDIPW
jgi:uncharacterized protein (DUF736 family)